MSSACTLYQLLIEELEESRKKISSNLGSRNSLFLGKNWEVLLYVMGSGKLGKKPFVNLFAPPNTITENASGNTDVYSYLLIEEIDEILDAITDIDKLIFSNRFNVADINTKRIGSRTWTNDDTKGLFILFSKLKSFLEDSVKRKNVIMPRLG